MIAPKPTVDEEARLRALRSYDILDTTQEQVYDDLTFLASFVTGTPTALISLVDRDRQWFKSRVGLLATQTPREQSFCAHAIHSPGEVMVVPDASEDERFHDNPLVTGDPKIRFYAGAPLVTAEGHALGTLCVIGAKPGKLSAPQRRALQALSRQAVGWLELHRAAAELGTAIGQEERGPRPTPDLLSRMKQVQDARTKKVSSWRPGVLAIN